MSLMKAESWKSCQCPRMGLRLASSGQGKALMFRGFLRELPSSIVDWDTCSTPVALQHSHRVPILQGSASKPHEE